MKAFVLNRYGKQQTLELAEVPVPQLRDDEVLVEVHAAGVNPLDCKLRNGDFKMILRYPLPLVMGHEMAGVVVQLGRLVRQFQPGDEVMARVNDLRIGTFAEFVAVKATSLARKPRNLSMNQAASVPLVGLTAWQALVERAQVSQGQKVFIQAGSGGVGSFAIQLAKHLGATVATTASAGSFTLVKGLGADVVVDYTTQDFEDVLHGYDVVLNSQDGKTLDKSLRVLKRGGKLVSVSGPPDPAYAAQISAPALITWGIRLLSAGVRRRARQRGVEYSFLVMQANGQQLQQIADLMEAGVIRPVLDKVFAFAATNEALAYVQAGHAKGKVVVSLKQSALPAPLAYPALPPQ